jgi:hypothetical protein
LDVSEASEYVAPSPELAALLARAERFSRAVPPARNGERLASDLVHLRHTIDLLELAFSERASAFNASAEYDSWGSVSAVDWIRHHCDMSRSAAGDRVVVGDEMPKLRSSVDAVAGREIGFAHLSLIAHTARAVRDSEIAQPLVEEAVLARAMEMSVGAFRYFCEHARHAADPEGVNGEQVNAVEQRKLRFSNWDQSIVLVSGQLDAVGAAALRTALLPLARKHGRYDYRHRDRRLADALVELAASKLQRPHLQVTTSLETLLGLSGSPAAELELAPPIPAKSVERLACDRSLTRVLLGPDSLVINVGRSKRIISGPQRRALVARDKHCRWPGCERPATYTEGHHLVHWSRGGPTDLANLVLLCYRHHWLVHQGGWQLVKTDDGQLLTVKPLRRIWETRARAPDVRAA